MILEGFYWELTDTDTDTINELSVNEFLAQNQEYEIQETPTTYPNLVSAADAELSINGSAVTGGGAFGGTHPPIPTRPRP